MAGQITPGRVLIVGAGIAGLALARALRTRGVSGELIERSAEYPEAGTGVYLPANGFRALAQLALDQAVARQAAVISHQRLLDHRGRVLTVVDLASVWGAGGPCIALLRSDLHRALLDGAAGVPMRRGVTVDTVTQDDEGVRVGFSDGATGTFHVVVGADGVHSSIRRVVFAGADPHPVGQISWRFVVHGFPGITTWTVMLGKRKTFLMVPVGQERLYCYADVEETGVFDQAQAESERLPDVFRDFAEPVPAILTRLSAAPPPYVSRIEEVVQDTWVRGRVILLGDAAHAMSPNMAQGASLALEDALVLAEVLTSRRPVAACLASFEARRRPRVRWVQEQTHRRDRMRNLPPALRNVVLRAAGQRIFSANYRPLVDAP